MKPPKPKALWVQAKELTGQNLPTTTKRVVAPRRRSVSGPPPDTYWPSKRAPEPATKLPQRIRRRTPKRQAEERVYLKRVREILATNPPCWVSGCTARAVECHHRCGRRGDLLLDERWWAMVCKSHAYISHNDVPIARSLKLIPELGWNRIPPEWLGETERGNQQ